MSVLADRASGAGVLDRLQVLRSAPTPLRGAPAATWPPSPRTGVRQLRVAGPGLQPWLQDTTTTRTDPAGSTLATPVLGPRNGVHLPLQALRGEQTMAELSSRYKIHPNLIANWKKKAQEALVDVFSDHQQRREASRDAEIQELRAKVGELVIEKDVLSKAFGR